MQRLTLVIPVNGFVPRDSFRVYGNVSPEGLAEAEIDFEKPITGDVAAPFWPLAADIPGHGEGLHGEGYHGGVPTEVPADREVVTPACFFGEYRFAVQTFDDLRNASAGEPAEFKTFVNSGPRPVRNFHQESVEDGVAVFAFTAPPQYR